MLRQTGILLRIDGILRAEYSIIWLSFGWALFLAAKNLQIFAGTQHYAL